MFKLSPREIVCGVPALNFLYCGGLPSAHSINKGYSLFAVITYNIHEFLINIGIGHDNPGGLKFPRVITIYKKNRFFFFRYVL